mmetsp:Transcript_128067/g.370656  ORF Transcript_128067/g.370656 Transcript_128067/m.370656 type:complete len:289 (-) Transcript_128067:381-1247(-)
MATRSNTDDVRQSRHGVSLRALRRGHLQLQDIDGLRPLRRDAAHRGRAGRRSVAGGVHGHLHLARPFARDHQVNPGGPPSRRPGHVQGVEVHRLLGDGVRRAGEGSWCVWWPGGVGEAGRLLSKWATSGLSRLGQHAHTCEFACGLGQGVEESWPTRCDRQRLGQLQRRALEERGGVSRRPRRQRRSRTLARILMRRALGICPDAHLVLGQGAPRVAVSSLLLHRAPRRGWDYCCSVARRRANDHRPRGLRSMVPWRLGCEVGRRHEGLQVRCRHRGGARRRPQAGDL